MQLGPGPRENMLQQLRQDPHNVVVISQLSEANNRPPPPATIQKRQGSGGGAGSQPSASSSSSSEQTLRLASMDQISVGTRVEVLPPVYAF